MPITEGDLEAKDYIGRRVFAHRIYSEGTVELQLGGRQWIELGELVSIGLEFRVCAHVPTVMTLDRPDDCVLVRYVGPAYLQTIREGHECATVVIRGSPIKKSASKKTGARRFLSPIN